MATITAHILVGEAHPNHEGICPSHQIYLSENSRPALTLTGTQYTQATEPSPRIVWVPTVEHMLEDALLMIAIHVAKDPEILEMVRGFTTKIESERVEMYEDLDDSQREMLYAKCRELSTFPKIIVCVFRESAFWGQLEVLETYKMSVEVCWTNYSRLYSAWTKKTCIEGTLKKASRDKDDSIRGCQTEHA